MNKLPYFSVLLAVALIVALVAGNPGCGKEDGPVVPPPPSPCDAADTTAYGIGSCSFFAPGAGDTFSVSGRYKTSMEFAGDTASRGAGGFVRDTILNGNRLTGEFVAYDHRKTAIGINERILVLTCTDLSKRLSPGDYAFAPPGTPSSGMSATGWYLYYTDSLGLFSIYEMITGVLSVASIDTCSKHCTGTFAGTLRGLPPDTSLRVVLSGGTFDLQYVPHPFTY